MKEENKFFRKEENSLIIPGIILIIFFVAVYATHDRVYKQKNVHYFISEQDVENFNPLETIYGNNK